MGMSASQVRFLSLQTRKNAIGNELSTLANRKQSLARDMKVVSAKYDNATNQTELKWSYNSGETYSDISYDLLMRPNMENLNVPYIITDASSGKVILNNDVVCDFDGKPIMVADTKVDLHVDHDYDHVYQWTTTSTDTKPLTYVTLARMISGWTAPEPSNSGFNAGNSHVFSDMASGDIIDPGMHVAALRGKDYDYDISARTSSGDANPDAYVIPKSYDFSVTNSLRMDIFKKMGLVSQDKIDKYNSLLEQLYGNEAAYNSGVYSTDCAMGQYYLALANKEAYYALPNQYINVAKDSSTNINYTSEFSVAEYGFLNNITGNKTYITQASTGNSNGALQHVSFDGVEASSSSFTANDGTVFTQSVNDTGITLKYELNNIWDSIEAIKGESIEPVRTQIVDNSSSSPSTTTDQATYTIGSNSYPNISSVESVWKTDADAQAINKISDIVYSSVETLLANIVNNANVNLRSDILYRIKTELLSALDADSAFDVSIHNNLTASNVNSSILADKASVADKANSEPAGDIPKVYLLKGSRLNVQYDYAFYNVENMKQYVMDKYSQYSNAPNDETWCVKYRKNDEIADYLTEQVTIAEKKVESLKQDIKSVFSSTQQKQMDYYDALFQKISQSGWIQDKDTSIEQNGSKSNAYLQQKLSNNIFFITECKTAGEDVGYNFTTKMATGVAKVYSVHNTDAEGIALTKYESEKTEIQAKERKIDVIMSKLETEQEAINSEMDSIENQINDNINSVFKMFA